MRFNEKVILAAFLVSLAACDSGGGGGGGGTSMENPDDSLGTVEDCQGSGSVAVTGKVEFERVPVEQRPLNGEPFLNFDNRIDAPVRRATVEAICPADSSVYDSTVTDDDGLYALTVPENVSVRIRAKAEMLQAGTPGWTVRVVNTSGGSVWSLTGDTIDSATGSVTVNLRAPSGWTDSSTTNYTASRSAGPFALLDTVYKAMQTVLVAEPGATFPELRVNWAPDYSGGTYYTRSAGVSRIFILGDANTDTDEYDEHIVAHEWGHYYEDRFARSDSIGGGHSGSEHLDVRVAFGEGFGNAWSGMVLGDDIYKDTFATDNSPGGTGFALGLESRSDNSFSSSGAGWYDEGSIHRILFDIYDESTDVLDGDSDLLRLGFGPIHAVLANEQKQTPLLTNLFPFIYHLGQNTGLANELDVRLNADDIDPVADPEGSGRSNDGDAVIDSKYVLPIFQAVPTDGTPVEICSTDVYSQDAYASSGSGNHNKLGARRFATFSSSKNSVTVSVVGGTGDDPEFRVWLKGEHEGLGEDTSTVTATETRAVTLTGTSNDYVVELWDAANVDANDSTGGNVCYDVSIN